MRRLKIAIGGLLTTLFVVLSKPILVGISTVSGLITICEPIALKSQNKFLQTYCDYLVPSPSKRPEANGDDQPDSNGIEKLYFIGNWKGRWDGKWPAQFYVKGITLGKGSNQVSIDYVVQENLNDSKLTTQSLECEFVNINKIYCPPQIEIQRTDAHKAIATFFGRGRVLKADLTGGDAKPQ